MKDITLLDCTLRDGGYINDWNWGYDCAKEIIRKLVKAHVDVVEVGFLRNVDGYNPDVTVCNTIEELNKLLPKKQSNTMFSAMAMRSNYDIEKLSPYMGMGIEMIRVTAHNYDLQEGLEYAQQIKDKGYKVSVNPINIMGYTDQELLDIIQKVNTIQPYQFAIVDTFGSMRVEDFDRILSIVEHNLHKDIRIALHLHENMALSVGIAQAFINKHMIHPISIDASLMGMGRTPGNLPIEIIVDYLNEKEVGRYDSDYILDAVFDYIEPLKGETAWGYTTAYFLSAKFNLHRNYAEHYLSKGDLTHRDINHILSQIETKKKSVYDVHYADKLYFEYKNRTIDDSKDFAELKKLLKGRDILLLAPGDSIYKMQKDIQTFIDKSKPICISINFVPEEIPIEYAFFGNGKRFGLVDDIEGKTIITSNIDSDACDYMIDYNRISGAFAQGDNSLIMLLKLLENIGITRVSIAGADGYLKEHRNYYSSMLSAKNNSEEYNREVKIALSKIHMALDFVTPSIYE